MSTPPLIDIPRFLAKDLNSWFYEDRAAHIASCQLPLIVALAGKNNIISCEYDVYGAMSILTGR